MGEEALKNGTVSRIAKVHHKASCQRSNNKYEVMRVKQKKNKRRMRRKKTTTKTKRRRISVDNNPQHPLSSLTVADDAVGRRINVDNNPQHPVSSLTVADDAVGRWISVDNNPQHPVSSLTVADDAVCSLIAGDDVVVCQILSRLPVISLMRFKCVCKRWKSIIEEDSHFINLHLGHSEKRPSLFILLQKNAEFIKRYHESFLSADLHFTGRAANIHTVSKPLSFSYRKVLGPIAGLICFVDVFAVRVYNVSTREVTPWIISPVFAKLEKENGMVNAFNPRPICNFGFDQTTKKHKVIFIWCEGKFQKFPVCEVLTVGDNTWREIDELPPYLHIGATSVSANGSIYWNLLRHFVGGGIGIKPKLECSDSEDMKLFDDEDTDWIMAFDIGSEKFRMILTPQDQRSKYDESFNEFSLSVVDGCLAIISQTAQKLRMWIFRDHNKENGTTITISEKNWTRFSIELPSEWTRLRRSVIYVHSVSGTDQIILETYRDSKNRGKRDVKAANFYLYNQERKTRNLEIKGISSIPEDYRAECSTFVESLLPVRKKL